MATTIFSQLSIECAIRAKNLVFALCSWFYLMANNWASNILLFLGNTIQINTNQLSAKHTQQAQTHIHWKWCLQAAILACGSVAVGEWCFWRLGNNDDGTIVIIVNISIDCERDTQGCRSHFTLIF